MRPCRLEGGLEQSSKEEMPRRPAVQPLALFPGKALPLAQFGNRLFIWLKMNSAARRGLSR